MSCNKSLIPVGPSLQKDDISSSLCHDIPQSHFKGYILIIPIQQLTSTLSDLSSGPITLEIAESLRLLERKVASVYTLMKASVYTIVLQQGQIDGDAARLEGEGERTEGMTTLPMR